MVEAAECQAIADLVRAASSVPFDVGGFEAEQVVHQANVEAADGAMAFVGSQDIMAELGIARPTRCVAHLVRRESYRVADVLVQRCRKVPVE